MRAGHHEGSGHRNLAHGAGQVVVPYTPRAVPEVSAVDEALRKSWILKVKVRLHVETQRVGAGSLYEMCFANNTSCAATQIIKILFFFFFN